MVVPTTNCDASDGLVPPKSEATKKNFACSADVAINFGLGFIPGYNGVKAAAAFTGINFNPVEAALGIFHARTSKHNYDTILRRSPNR